MDEKELKKRGKELEKREKDLEEMQAHVDERVAALEEKMGEFEEKEKALAGKEQMILQEFATIDKPEEEQKLTKAEEKLITEGCEAYGIGKESVLKARVDRASGEAVIVTHGGAKVRYASGAEVRPLEVYQVDGVIRKKMKPITGGKKK